MRMAEIERVEYKTAEILSASEEFLVNYARYSGVRGMEDWPYQLIELQKIISDQLPIRFDWNSPEVELSFSGFKQYEIHEEDNSLSFYEISPFFEIREGEEFNLLNPERRSQLEKFTQQLVESMSDIHKLESDWIDPALVVRFPKKHYAENIDVSTTVIFE